MRGARRREGPWVASVTAFGLGEPPPGGGTAEDCVFKDSLRATEGRCLRGKALLRAASWSVNITGLEGQQKCKAAEFKDED